MVGTGEDRQKVFTAICFGKRKIKLISEIVAKTQLPHKRVLEEGARLANARLVTKKRIEGEMAYVKDDFLSSKLGQILRLASDPKALAEFPTKSNPRSQTSNTINVTMRIPKNMFDIKEIKIDNIDSFSKVRDIPFSTSRKLVPIGENVFQAGLQKIIQEEGEQKDWGGETDDLFSTRLTLHGQRVNVAFGLKGKGTAGKLVPKKMGKDGDQIQRLFKAPADVFLVQYWNQMDESILEEMKNMATTRSLYEGKTIYYGIIDGQDTQRIILAYPEFFPLNILKPVETVVEARPTTTVNPTESSNFAVTEPSLSSASADEGRDKLLNESDRQGQQSVPGDQSVPPKSLSPVEHG